MLLRLFHLHVVDRTPVFPLAVWARSWILLQERGQALEQARFIGIAQGDLNCRPPSVM
jgi:hypothetical protein